MLCKTIVSKSSTYTDDDLKYLRSVKQKNGTTVSDVYPELKSIIDYIKSKNLPKLDK